MITTELNYHIPVLLKESIEGLKIKPDGIYVDATFGGGGHSKEILKNIKNGKLIAFDKDNDSPGNDWIDSRFIFVNHDFKYIKRFLVYYGFTKVDGILADLGVSSHHFDVAERGFSHRGNYKLDMRMDRNQELTAFEIINNYSESDIANILFQYGEIIESKLLAKKICEARNKKQIELTSELVDIIKRNTNPKNEGKTITLVFQALRIAVNNELDALKSLLLSSAEILKPKGRLVIISYHSLEDRMVKNYTRSGNFAGNISKDIYGKSNSIFSYITKKAIIPTQEEIKTNPRSRSAHLRIAEKN